MSTPLEKHVYLGLSEVSSAELTSEKTKTSHLTENKAVKVLNFKATELRLGLPGSESPERVKVNDGNDNDEGTVEFNGVNLLVKNMVSGAKRGFSVAIHGTSNKETTTPASRAQLVGWPPVRSFRKNSMAMNAPKTNDNQDSKSKLEIGCHYIKVSMDGAPYLRKIDLKTFGSYVGLSSALETMFSGFTMSQYGNKGHLCADERNEGRLIDSLQRSEYVLTYEDKDGDWMLVGDVPWNMFINTCKRLRIMKSSEAVGLTSRVSNG